MNPSQKLPQLGTLQMGFTLCTANEISNSLKLYRVSFQFLISLETTITDFKKRQPVNVFMFLYLRLAFLDVQNK